MQKTASDSRDGIVELEGGTELPPTLGQNGLRKNWCQVKWDFIPSFGKYLLSACCVVGRVLDRNMKVNRHEVSSKVELAAVGRAYILCRKRKPSL